LARAIGGVVLLALVILALLFQWNWLRGPLAAAISGRLHRPVTIAGDLHVHPWSALPWASVDGLTIGNPAWAGGGAMAKIPRLTVQTRWWPLLGGQVVFPQVRIERPWVRLVTDQMGRQNWNFSDRPNPPPARLPPIGHLVIIGGTVSYGDARRRLAFAGTVSSDERPGAATDGNLTTIEGALTAGGAAWAGPAPLARAPRVLVKAKLLALMGGKLVLPLVEADRPVVRLVRDAAGRENWRLNNGDKPFKAPPIGRLVLEDGQVTYADVKGKLTFSGTISSNESVGATGRGAFVLQGKGVLNSAPFTARIAGGPLVNIDAARPYPFDARIDAGTSKVAASGIVVHPFDFTRVSGRIQVSGEDLANLYHMTGVALPSTPPYNLSAGFSRVGKTVALRRLAGRVGDSDLAGQIDVNDARGRPFVTADLASRRLKLADLAAVIGGVPKHLAGHTLSPAQKAMAAKLKAEHRILPDAHLDVARMRTTDARLSYRAAGVDAGNLPIRGLLLKLTLDRGVLDVNPLNMSLPQGDLAGTIRLDARGAAPTEAVDFKLANARLEHLIERGVAQPPLTGGLYGRAKLTGSGDSVRAAAADANGTVSLAIPGGEIRQAFAELLGIDAAKGLFLLIAKNHGVTPIRCAVADFSARDGVLTAQRIVFDTGVVLALGKGRIDLRNESLDLQLTGKPKKFRLVRIGAPITVKGYLAAPKFGVDVGKAIPQLVVSGVIGAVVSPLAVILPFVNPGLGKNADCAALMSQASAAGAGVVRR